ncbi:unnamed protein product [marine sediment metagenome]|jgi:hypothetical protein|uniref:Uncharacterized protein n=1 Tax=marine sediment metagenome TaxID=412755 RepID=X1FLU5_9ZZZZ
MSTKGYFELKPIKDFKVNEYITLKLEGIETVIYVLNNKFRSFSSLENNGLNTQIGNIF